MIVMWAIVFLTFCTTWVVILLVYNSATQERRTIAKRIQTHTTFPDETLRQKRAPKSLKVLFKDASRVFVSRGLALKAETDLVRAGIPLSGEEGLMLWALMFGAAGILSYILSRDVGTVVVFMALAGAAPFFILKFVTGKRIEKFDHQICSALVIMANSLRAGFSFMQALEMVGKEMTDPIASEFRRVLREMNLGVPTEQALVNMGTRVGSKDLDLVVTAILIQRQVGGNLAEVLTNISDTIRGRFQLAREVKVLTAQGRISGMVIGLLPVILTIILYLINKDYIIPLFTDPRGLAMLGLSVLSQLVGLMFIRKIVDVQM